MNATPDSALALREALRRLRRGWRRRILAEGAARVAATALLALIAGALISAVAGPGSMTVVTVRVLGYLLIGAATIRFLVLPSFRRPDDARLALYVEERAPEIRQALLSAVHALEAPAASHESPGLAALVIRRALDDLARLESGPGLERPGLRRAAGLFAAAAAGLALLLLGGPRVLRDTARVLFVPWSEAEAAPVMAVLVAPGDASVPRGGAIEVHATLRGFAAEGAELAIRPDTAQEWIRLPMLRDSTSGGFSARLFDLTRATEYYVEADAVRSRAYHLTVTNLPAVRKLSLELRFPAYTGKAPERIEDGGDVAAVVGTTVVVHAATTMPVQGGALRLDGGAPIALAGDSAGVLSGSFRVSRDGFYRVDLVATDGTPVPGGVQYAIEALEDHAPILRIEEPGRDTKATSVDEVTVAVRASDDYGVTGLDLRYSVNGGPEQRIGLTDSTARRGNPELRAAHTLFLEEMGLKAGDLVAYHATAKDAAGNTAASDIYFLEIRPFGKDYRQAEQGGGAGQAQGDSPDGLSARQREIVAGTFNWLRDSAKTAERRRREDLTTLAISQSHLKDDVTGLARRLLERNAAAVDTGFRAIHAQLDTAAREMQGAEEQLGSGRPTDALPPEQKALQHLQRAEALFRDVQVQMGQQGGGGGGGAQSRAEDLADLFDLETDKLKNQYEAVQQDQAESAQKELDATAERLKQLASRQQQENERMQRMADAMQERLGQSGGGGGGSQRELAKQVEEEARRLERLAREKNDPALADAARRLQESADAMRRAASGGQGSAQQGGSALDKLRNATRDLENARASRLSEAVKSLAQRAEELGARQKEIGEGVAGLQQTPPADRAEKLRRLDERKDALAGDVDRLEGDAQRLSREAQRDQRGAAGKLGQAAEAIRDTRIRDKVVYSKGVMRAASPAYARTLEDQIAGNLGDVTDKLREAAGALTEDNAAQRDRTLDRARELVRGLESLRQRIADRADPGRGDSTGPGQAGQQGQGAPPGRQGQAGQSGRQGQAGQPGQGGQAGGQQGQQGQSGQQGRGGQGQQPGQGGTGGTPGGGNQSGMGGGSPAGGGGTGGRLGSGDIRQFQREFGLRREAAESLRRELAGQNLEAGELNGIIDNLRRLESGRPFADPKGLEDLQRAVVEGLKSWEFKLWRTLGQGKDGQPALGGPSEAPPAYRALVEEYYRALSRKAPPKP